MKKRNKFLIVSIITLLLLSIALGSTANALTGTVSFKNSEGGALTEGKLSVGDKFIYTITFDETIVATNFKLNINQNVRVDRALTENLTIGENNQGVIKCIYADSSLTGTDKLEIECTALSAGEAITNIITTQELKTITKAKAEGQEEVTYTDEQITREGEDTPITIETEPLTPTSNIVRFVQEDIAYGEGDEVTKKYVAVILGNEDEDRKITVAELIAEIPGQYYGVCSYNESQQKVPLENADFVKTGDYLDGDDVILDNQKAVGMGKIILFGDPSADGEICDTDDVMVIINDYLGKNIASIDEKIAADLNRDDLLDVDDILRMFKMYLGTLNGDLVDNAPEQNITSFN